MLYPLTPPAKFFTDETWLVCVTNNEASGCIDCVGSAIYRADWNAAGKVRRVGANVAQICGWVAAICPFPQLDLQLDITLVRITSRSLGSILMTAHARHDQNGQDAENYHYGHQLC
jgi:hypothetical protein